MATNPESTPSAEFDYIIVGSGAGGAPLAARLVQGRKRVLVIEAGPNHTERGPRDPGNEVSRVPLLHAVSTEHEALSWRYFVDHYERLPDGVDPDPKFHQAEPGEDPAHNGIFYPRATGIGGCTVHNAMITIAGPDSDWDELADYLKDETWRSNHMRAYFQRLEHNDYYPSPDTRRYSSARRTWQYVVSTVRWLFGKTPDPTRGRHGFDGWLHTSTTDLSLGLADKQLVKVLKATLWKAKVSGLNRAWTLISTLLKGRFRQALDPNHAETQANHPEGIALIPLAVCGPGTTIHQDASAPNVKLGSRSSPRELLQQVQAEFPNRLEIWTDCLVTQVLLENKADNETPVAVGVELLRGASLYRAHVKPSLEKGIPQTVKVKAGGEVILCGGSFNTPQLLMLSGIGDPQVLKDVPNAKSESGTGIECKVELPGVGKNLQDRYEVSVISQMRNEFSLLAGATFALPKEGEDPDPHLRRWRSEGTGLCTSNGGIVAILKRSRPDLIKPDLFIFGVPSYFRGYEVGYSKPRQHNLFSWVILKAHTHNQDGFVQLRTADPLDTPKINFNSFRSASHPEDVKNDADVLALHEGVKFVRGIFEFAPSIVSQEIHPGTALVPQNDDDAAKRWILRDAWGHHACGTCRMGPDGDPNAVLDSHFRVRKVKNLRVVDASIFPKIPGYFIVTNIYMASEKAADVILRDANPVQDTAFYPAELQELEAAAIAKRRQRRGPRVKSTYDEKVTLKVEQVVSENGEWQDDVSALALSGGGIRSATFSLGILQSMARYHHLRRIDFLSTVSGGGYIGSFLGRFYDRLRPTTEAGNLAAIAPATHIEQELTAPDSKSIEWLRMHGNYIAPQAPGSAKLNVAVFIRNLLSLHIVIGLAIFTVFGLANLIRYGVFDQIFTGVGLVIDKSHLPLGHLMAALLGPFFSPWFILVDLLVLFLVLPKMVGYWIVSQDRHETFKSVPTVMLFLVSGVLLWLGVSQGLRLEPLSIGAALLSSFICVELAWWRGVRQEDAIGTGGVEAQRRRTRNYLTSDLGLALSVTGGAIVFAVIDTLGHAIHQWKVDGNATYSQEFAALGVAIMTVFPIARAVAGYFTETQGSGTSTISRILLRDMALGLMAIVLFTLPLVFYSFTAHAAYFGGNQVWLGLAITLGTGLLTYFLALPSAVVFVNRSSIAQTYSDRLARAYLGATNPLRRQPIGMNVTEVVPGDDVASIRDYKPHEASGPFHLINMTIDQTIDKGSLLRKRDRQGNIMAVSCLGVTVGETSHAQWVDGAVDFEGTKGPTGLRPLGLAVGTEHPLVDQLGIPADQAEMLSLREWIGISGAAIDPGSGQGTNLGKALLLGMVNLRTGHWWDTGIAEASRVGFPHLSFLGRLLYAARRAFTTQSLILAEWTAMFPGSWERFWHLSDGGFFECLGGYELIRRRIPRIVICDGCADPKYQFSELGQLIRKARIDFGIRITSLTPAEIVQHVPTHLQAHVGTYDDLRQTLTPLAPGNPDIHPKQAGLLWVHYPDGARRSVILYLKAKLAGNESPDIQHYHDANPDFPQEATADQFFDEAQWESYRKLGEHLSDPLFAVTEEQPHPELELAKHWFWKIPLTNSIKGAP